MTDKEGIGRKQLSVLFLCSLFTIGYAGPLIRLLPVHASQIGAGPAQTGTYLALTYAGLTVATLVAGWLGDRYGRRKALIIAAALMASITLGLMSRSAVLWQLALASFATWFFGGIGYTLFMIVAGLHAREDERGKVFGMLATTLPLGTLLVAPVAGAVADRFGYPTLLAGYAVYALIIPILAMFIKDPVEASQEEATAGEVPRPEVGPVFHIGLSLIVAATLVMSYVGFVATLGFSLAMHALMFTSAQIAVAAAAGSFVGVPLPFLFGWVSDRYSRKGLLAAVYLAVGAGTLVLATASLLWQFWIASMLMAVAAASDSLSNAITVDLAPRHVVGRWLSYTNAARWLGAVAGLALAGYAIEFLGMRNTFVTAFAFVPVAVLMVSLIRRAAASYPSSAAASDVAD